MMSGRPEKPKRMTAGNIPAFVREVADTGCEICAVGHEHYLIGDAELSEEDYETALPKLERIQARYGARDHLRLEIIAHLHSIGRVFEYESTDDA